MKIKVRHTISIVGLPTVVTDWDFDLIFLQNERTLDKIEDDDEDFVDDEEVDREYEDKDVDGKSISMHQSAIHFSEISKTVVFQS